MFENRRYKRYDVSKEKIAVQVYDVSGFTFVGYLSDISKGGFKFKTKSSVKWKQNDILTVYLQLPGQSKLVAIDVRAIRTNNKLFSAYHAGEFIGSFVEFNELTPLLSLKAEAQLAGTM